MYPPPPPAPMPYGGIFPYPGVGNGYNMPYHDGGYMYNHPNPYMTMPTSTVTSTAQTAPTDKTDVNHVLSPIRRDQQQIKTQLEELIRKKVHIDDDHR